MVDDLPAGRPRRPTAADHVADTIRDLITTGELAPGQRLIEADLVRRLGLSRGPVREGLRHLEAEGLVTMEPHRGASVRSMTSGDLAELFAVRELVEGGAAGFAATAVAGGASAADLVATMAECDAAARLADGGAYARANERLHQAILHLAGNRLLAELSAQLQTHAQRVLFLRFMAGARVRDSNAGHHEVVEAILAGDAPRAEAAMRRHIRLTADYVVTLGAPPAG